MIDPLHVAARGVLHDALDALGDQREALILAGAQAIYSHPVVFIDGEKIQTLAELFARLPAARAAPRLLGRTRG